MVELKTTKGDPSLLWDDQRKQALIYGLLLDLMGLDCSKLRLAVVRVKVDKLSEADRSGWTGLLSEALLDSRTEELERKFNGMMKVHVLEHDRRAAVAAIAEKATYWTMKREADSSTVVAKCRACEYRDVCQRSLAK